MSINKRETRETDHSNNRILLSNEKENTTYTCNSMDGSQSTKPNKFRYKNEQEKLLSGVRNQNSGCLWMGRGADWKGRKQTYWGDGNV